MIKYRILRSVLGSYPFWLFFVGVVVIMVGIAIAHALAIPLLGFAIGGVWAVARHNHPKQVNK